MDEKDNHQTRDRFIIQDCGGTPSRVVVDFNRTDQLDTQDIDFTFVEAGNVIDYELSDAIEKTDCHIKLRIPENKIPSVIDWLAKRYNYWKIDLEDRENSTAKAYRDILAHIRKEAAYESSTDVE